MMPIAYGLKKEIYNPKTKLLTKLNYFIMASVMSLKKLKNHPSRSGFDLSRKVAYSAKIGELLPVECIECIPGDSFKIQKQHFTRTMPVNTAAYTRIREYYDWFFVPTNLLWNQFNTFVSQMVDNGQQATSITNNVVLGNRHPYITSSQINNYLVRVEDDSTYSNNMFGYSRANNTRKLLEYLGYKSEYSTGRSPSDFRSDYVANPFPLLAYQKIYQDYYRNSQWEKSYAPAWNINYMWNKDAMELPISGIDLSVDNMFDLRYCNWNKDYFMGLLPNSQFGAPATIQTQGFNNQIVVTDSSGRDIPVHAGIDIHDSYSDPSRSVLGYNQTNVQSGMLTLADGYNISQFSILALRQAEAAQKWAEITQSSQQDYKAQMEAHFGVSLSDAYSDRCKFIDGHVSNLDISEVINQSLNADDSALIKGKGVGVGEGYMNFSTDVHGYLMCVYHAVPILDYRTSGIKKRNLKSYVTDYAIPEFDKTGMVKVPFIELMSRWPAIRNLSTLDQIQLGYAPQYYEYKTNYDEILGALAHGGTQLESWVSPFTEDYIYDYMEKLYDAGLDSINYQFFKVNPDVMNPIFVAQVDPDNNDIDVDQLLINCSFDIKAVRNLDYDGLPY